MIGFRKLIFFAGTLTVVLCHITRLQECNKFSATFKVKKLRVKDKLLRQGHLKKLKNVENKERCSTLCIENPKCESAIYQMKDHKNCILYDRKFHESELEKSSSVYYMTTEDSNDGLLVSN